MQIEGFWNCWTDWACEGRELFSHCNCRILLFSQKHIPLKGAVCFLWRPDDGVPHAVDGPAYFATLDNDGAHGGPFRYRSVLTDVLGWVVEKAGGALLHELIEAEIWGPMGGYVASVALRAAGAHSRFDRPASIVGHFLGVAETPKVTKDHDELLALADWLPHSPMFARMQVNRVWFNLLGRGIVDPVDDFRASNPPASAIAASPASLIDVLSHVVD